jgi:hypothetical protein
VPKGQVALVGCLQHAPLDAQAIDPARGGSPANLALGEGFVLADARPSPPAGTPVGTSGGGRRGRTFTLGGNIRPSLADALGRRVEIVGTLDTASSSDTAKAPRLNVTVWHELGDACPAP